MAKGTGVFIPKYETKRSRGDNKAGHAAAANAFGHTAGSCGGVQSAAPSARSPNMFNCSGTNFASGAVRSSCNSPCTGQQLQHLPLQQHLLSPPASISSSSDLGALSVDASGCSFTSTCSSLLAPIHNGNNSSPFAAYACAAGSLTPCGLAAPSSPFAQLAAAPAQPQLTPLPSGLDALPVGTMPCLLQQLPLSVSDDLSELLLLQQQEAEVDAAINNLLAARQQLAMSRQQPAAPTGHLLPLQQQQPQLSMAPALSLPVSLSTAALLPHSTPTNLPIAAYANTDTAMMALQQQQQAAALQAEMLRLLSLTV